MRMLFIVLLLVFNGCGKNDVTQSYADALTVYEKEMAVMDRKKAELVEAEALFKSTTRIVAAKANDLANAELDRFKRMNLTYEQLLEKKKTIEKNQDQYAKKAAIEFEPKLQSQALKVREIKDEIELQKQRVSRAKNAVDVHPNKP